MGEYAVPHEGRKKRKYKSYKRGGPRRTKEQKL